MLGMKMWFKTNHVILGVTSPAFVERIDKSLCLHLQYLLIPNPSISQLSSKSFISNRIYLFTGFSDISDYEALHRLHRPAGCFNQCCCYRLLGERASNHTYLRYLVSSQRY